MNSCDFKGRKLRIVRSSEKGGGEGGRKGGVGEKSGRGRGGVSGVRGGKGGRGGFRGGRGEKGGFSGGRGGINAGRGRGVVGGRGRGGGVRRGGDGAKGVEKKSDAKIKQKKAKKEEGGNVAFGRNRTRALQGTSESSEGRGAKRRKEGVEVTPAAKKAKKVGCHFETSQSNASSVRSFRDRKHSFRNSKQIYQTTSFKFPSIFLLIERRR